MSDNDLILLLDDSGDIQLDLDGQIDLIIEDAMPYSQHYSEYKGAYNVIPILHNEQVLPTIYKLMTDNVTVEPIPIAETTNVHGGTTVVIG